MTVSRPCYPIIVSNPFQMHALSNFSPSSINLFALDPACWTMQYLFGISGSSGSAAWRGNALEFALGSRRGAVE